MQPKDRICHWTFVPRDMLLTLLQTHDSFPGSLHAATVVSRRGGGIQLMTGDMPEPVGVAAGSKDVEVLPISALKQQT